MTAKPFVKIAGGKRKLAPKILELFPKDFRAYWEPFVGGGAVFFASGLEGTRCVLSDSNERLVNVYNQVRGDVDGVIRLLKRKKNTSEFFYSQRKLFNKKQGSLKDAATYIYLNKTCFNGLYRENKKGEFNAPFGRYENPPICDEENLRAASARLQGARIQSIDFMYQSPQRGDVVYFDPPYAPLNAKSFTNYTQDGFGERDQKRLRDYALGLKRRGVHVILSNSSAPLIYDLYKGRDWKIVEVDQVRSINCDGEKRGVVKELLIR